MIESCSKDEIDILLEAWSGDIKALISELLTERAQLIKQLEVSACAMSYGFVRGWKPELPDC